MARPKLPPDQRKPKRRTPHPGGDFAPADDGGERAKKLLLSWIVRNLPTGPGVRPPIAGARLAAEAGELPAESIAIACRVAGDLWPSASSQVLRQMVAGARRLTPKWEARLQATLSAGQKSF